MQPNRSSITRRSVLRLATALGAQALLAVPALADTATELSNAQIKLADAEAQLDAIASEYEVISQKQSETLDRGTAGKKAGEALAERLGRVQGRSAWCRRPDCGLDVNRGPHQWLVLLRQSHRAAIKAHQRRASRARTSGEGA